MAGGGAVYSLEPGPCGGPGIKQATTLRRAGGRHFTSRQGSGGPTRGHPAGISVEFLSRLRRVCHGGRVVVARAPGPDLRAAGANRNAAPHCVSTPRSRYAREKLSARGTDWWEAWF